MREAEACPIYRAWNSKKIKSDMHERKPSISPSDKIGGNLSQSLFLWIKWLHDKGIARELFEVNVDCGNFVNILQCVNQSL